jgi:hypothetical protein
MATKGNSKMKANEFITEAVKQRLDPKCRKGKHKEGTKIKGGVRVNNCVPNESVDEAANAAQQAAIAIAKKKKGVTEGFMDTVKQAFNDLVVGYPQGTSEGQFIQGWARAIRAETGRDIPLEKLTKLYHDYAERSEEIMQSHGTTNEGVSEGSDDSGAYDKWDPKHPDFVKNYRKFQASNPGATLKDYIASLKEGVSETAAWRRKEGKSKTGGLNKKGVASYRRENPGSKLQTAVTTKPSKLKKGSKASKRRKSFCARMGGVKGPMKKPNGKPTRKALALRKWNCESVEQLQSMLMIAESWARKHEGK